MGSNGLDWKNVGIRSYADGNKGARVERNLGEAGMQSEPRHSPPTPPLRPSPFRRGDLKGQTPVHAEAKFQPSARSVGVFRAAAGSPEWTASPAVPPCTATYHFPSGRQRSVAE